LRRGHADRDKRLAKQRRKIRVLRVLPILFIDHVRRCGLDEVLSCPDEQRRILTAASGTADVGVQGARSAPFRELP
jgi:hypothetical protein